LGSVGVLAGESVFGRGRAGVVSGNNRVQYLSIFTEVLSVEGVGFLQLRNVVNMGQYIAVPLRRKANPKK
jgi:hypothetical protein